MKPKIRDILLESPSGKADWWLSKQKDMDWARTERPRPARTDLVSNLGLKKQEDCKILRERLEKLSKNRAFGNFLESCTRCGICLDKCHYFISTGDVNNSPVGRANLVRRFLGRGGSDDNGDECLNTLYSYYYQCSECRRCSYFCPQGIDQAEITRNVREVFSEIGILPDYVAATVSQVYKTGNNMGLKDRAMQSVIDFVKEELLAETGKEIDMPLDKPKASILLIPSSADLAVNLDTLKGYAKVLYSLGKDWTISSRATEAANFGLFVNEKMMTDFGNLVVQEAINHGVEEVVWGECGHGWRTANNYVRYKLAERGIALEHSSQFTNRALKHNLLKVDKNMNDDLFNYHDPCNLSRGGNLVNEPREVLKAVVRETVESEYSKEKTFCCGAGGGLLADEKDWNDSRAWAGWPAVYSSWKTGAHQMISPCAIDKAQFPFVTGYHKVDLPVKGLMDVVGYALEV